MKIVIKKKENELINVDVVENLIDYKGKIENKEFEIVNFTREELLESINRLFGKDSD